MPHIPICPPELASKEALAVYEEFYTRMQFPSAPNFRGKVCRSQATAARLALNSAQFIITARSGHPATTRDMVKKRAE